MYTASHARALDHFVAGNYDQSVEWLGHSRALCADEYERAMIDDLTAYVLIRDNQLDKADKTLDMAIAGFLLSEEFVLAAHALVTRSEVLIKLDQPDVALDLLTNAIDIYQQFGMNQSAALTAKLRTDAHAQVAASFIPWTDCAF